MRIKHFLVLLLIVGVLFAFCACASSGDGEKTPGTTAPQTEQKPTVEQAPTVEQTVPEQPEVPVEDGKVTYTVKVLDGAGAPMAGVMVQICKDSCMPGMTDAQGVATFRVAEAEGYKVSFLSVPEGYTAEAEEFYFEAGSMELTLTLTAA